MLQQIRGIFLKNIVTYIRESQFYDVLIYIPGN